jgi:hypothetical protein
MASSFLLFGLASDLAGHLHTVRLLDSNISRPDDQQGRDGGGLIFDRCE